MTDPSPEPNATEERELPILCTTCGERNPSGFPNCWNCHASLPSLPSARRRLPKRRIEWAFEPRIADLIAGQESPARTRRTEIVFELAVVLLLILLPWFVSGLYYVFHEAPEYSAWDFVNELAAYAGTIGFLIYLAWRSGDWRRLLGLGRVSLAKEALWGVLALVGFYLVAILLVVPVVLLTDAADVPTWTRNDPQESGLAIGWLLIVLTRFGGALMEELLYRGYLWSRLTELTRRPYRAIFITAGLFALSHGYDPAGTWLLFVMGIYLGLIFARTRSIWRVTIFHWLWNLMVEFWA